MSIRTACQVPRSRTAPVGVSCVGAACVAMLVAALASAHPRGSGVALETPAEHTRLLAEQTAPQKEVPFNPADFDRYVGYYELSPTAFFHIFRRGHRYFTQLTGQHPVEVFPESANEFFATVVAAQISFVTGSGGRVTGLVLHQGGYLRPAARVSARVAARAQALLRRRIRDNIPAPGTAAAIRGQIDSFERTGHALYADMTPELAAAARQQDARAAKLFRAMGPFDSLRFHKVLPNGVDDYLATFAHGQLEIVIAPLSREGKIAGLFYHAIP